VLSYVGYGHYLFVALSSWWKEAYAKLLAQRLSVKYGHGRNNIVKCKPHMTLYSSAMASPARVKLASESGLNFTSAECQSAAGRYADLATLATARTLGMQFSVGTMGAAASCNKLAEVQ
jgi:hypothetical protein